MLGASVPLRTPNEDQPADSSRQLSRVLVTGASGFIGRHLVALLADGHEVHAVATHLPDAPIEPAIVWHEVDLLDAAATDALVEQIRPERLVHLAWYAEHGRFWTARENLQWVAATLVLLRAFAAAGGQRAVIAGTCAEYDWSALAEGSGVCSESDTPLLPHTLYGAAKHAVHLLADRYGELEGFAVAWGRVFFLYGQAEQRGRLVPAVATSLLEGRETPVSDGTQLRDFMHVQDVAGAFAAMLDSDVTGAVNVASGEGVSVKAVIETIAAASGRPELVRWGAVERPEGDPDALLADTERLRTEVGFEPSIALADGLAATVSWWRERLDA
jgi:nucleoside-diphosphate-sugar epimerase